MTPGIVRKSWLAAPLVLLACGGGKDATAPSVPTTVNVVTAAPTTAVAGSVVTPALTFSVKDQNGNPMAGIPVTITVTSGTGTITGTPAATTSGDTPIGTWTLGTGLGVNTISIKAGNLAPTTLSITAVAGPAAKFVVVTGGDQSAAAGTTITGISVRVTDQFGNGVGTRSVGLTVIEGGGSVSPSAGTTDETGLLSGISWTLGKYAFPQKLSVSSLSVFGTVSATVATQYSLEVRYFDGDPTPQVRAAFDSAVARIRGVITGAIADVTFANEALPSFCRAPGIVLNETIHGLVIYAQIHPIDGVGRILGSAGPCLVRFENKLAVVGVMEFDSEDLTNLLGTAQNPGPLTSVIMHEMLHVAGFGTVWHLSSPPLLQGAGTVSSRFTGINAQAACTAAGGTTLCTGGVAVENCAGWPSGSCGGGTRDGHWREGISTFAGFDSELMTGFVEGIGVSMPFSNITVQSLRDLGYAVNAQAADPYSIQGASLRALLQAKGPTESRWDNVRTPAATVTRSGVVTPIERQ